MSSSYARLRAARALEFEEGLLKTYCVEADVAAGAADTHDRIRSFLRELGNGGRFSVHDTDEPNFYLLLVSSQRDAPADVYSLDATDPRFWLIYTLTVTSRSDTFVRRRLTGSTKLDSAWFPVQLFEQGGTLGSLIGFGAQFDDESLTAEGEESSSIAMRLTGSLAPNARQALQDSELRPFFSLSALRIRRRQPEGVVNDWIYSSGKFTSVGDSFSAHAVIVSSLFRDLYRSKIVDVLEERASVGLAVQNQTTRYRGEALTLQVPRSLGDTREFVSKAFSGKPPFRLWGAPVAVRDDAYRVLGVDLHSGHRASFLVEQSSIQILLPRGACANLVARFLTLIQRHYDASASLISFDGEYVF
jgi:hypothetical protein